MATMSKRHPGRFGHIVAEIIQDIVGVGVVAINSTVLVIMAAVLAEYVPYKHFYHVVGNVVVYACLAAAIAMPFFVHHWRKRRPGSHPATDYVGRSVRRAGLLTLIGTMFIGKLVSPATRGMSRSSRQRW